jgi:prevent-host-death family protein
MSSMSEPLQYLTNKSGEKTAVVLPLSDYEKLMEDLEDLAVVAERRDEPIISHEQFKAELKRDGHL